MKVKVKFHRKEEKIISSENRTISKLGHLSQVKTNQNSDIIKRTQVNALSSASNWEKIEELLGEFDSLIGLKEIKNLLKEIAAFVEIQKQRTSLGLVAEPMTLHMLFKGSPGTGKTTVARLTGKLFKELGILSKGHLIEVDRADLVGEYIGHTAHKTKEQLKKAMGGILFIDEAYSLARGGERDFGKEATDILVRMMEDKRDDLIIILAGYTHEMDAFIRSNPGLKSRFPFQLEFPNYTVLELVAISEMMLDKRQYYFESDAKVAMEKLLRKEMLQGNVSSGNARFVRNIIEKAIRRQSVRLVKKEFLTKGELMAITYYDLTGENEIIAGDHEIADFSQHA